MVPTASNRAGRVSTARSSFRTPRRMIADYRLTVLGERWNRIWASPTGGRMFVVSSLACILLLGGICPRFNYAQEVPHLEPPGVHASLFGNLEKKITACDPTTDVQLCVLNAIWETADVTADGMVNVAEINRLFRIVAGGIGYGDYVISYNDTKSNRRDVPAAEPPENNELDFVIVASSVGAIATPALIANFDYNSDGMLSRTEILGDTDFANLVSEVQKQRRRLPNRIMEAFWRLRGGLFGTTARERDGQVATERRGEEEAQTDRTKLAEFCAEVPQSALCRGAREGQMRTERRGEEDARTDRTKLVEFCAEVPQSALCRDL